MRHFVTAGVVLLFLLALFLTRPRCTRVLVAPGVVVVPEDDRQRLLYLHSNCIRPCHTGQGSPDGAPFYELRHRK